MSKHVIKEETSMKKRTSPKILAAWFVIISVLGYVVLGYTISQYVSFSNSPNRIEHGVKTLGIVCSISSWLIVVLMARLQNFRYLFSALARQFKRGRIPLDERETQLRRKAYEQSYTLLITLLIAAGFFLLFTGHSLNLDSLWGSRLAVWLWLNLLVVFIFLPSLIAARNDED